MWIAVYEMNIWVIFAVHYLSSITKKGMKIIQAWKGFEPMTSAIPVQCSTKTIF